MKKYRQSQEALQLVRGAFSSGTSVMLGTSTGQAIAYKIRFPVILSGIDAMVEEADISRFNVIHLDKIEGGIKGATPQVLLKRTFTPEMIEEIRCGVTLYALQNCARVKELYKEVVSEFDSNQHFHKQTSSRMRLALFPILTMMKLAGWDYKTFAQVYSEVKVVRIKNTVEHEWERIWNNITQAPGVRLPTEEYKDRQFTLAELLADPHTRDTINLTNTGVYYHPETKSIIVNWDTVRSTLLRGSEFGGQHPKHLLQTAAQHPQAIGYNTFKSDRSIMRLFRQYGALAHNCSAMPIAALIEGLEDESIEEAIAKVTKPQDTLKGNAAAEASVVTSIVPLKGAKDNI